MEPSFVVLVLLTFKFTVQQPRERVRSTWVTVSQKYVRSTKFSPKVVAKTCLLKPQEGPCRAQIPMYYHDPKTMDCNNTFLWGGCQGNGNRFFTSEACMDYCLSKPNQRFRPKFCELAFDYGYCFGEVNRYYYDKFWKVCKKALYSGCGGNRNNFYNLDMCESVCRFGNGPIKPPSTSAHNKFIIINPDDAKSKDGGSNGSCTDHLTTKPKKKTTKPYDAEISMEGFPYKTDEPWLN